MPRHRHAFAYICVILRGQFVEAGDLGRFRVSPGDVLVHRPFEAHFDAFDRADVEVLNLPLPRTCWSQGRYAIADPDPLARMAETDPVAAAAMAEDSWTPAAGEADWPDLLAVELREKGAFSLGSWADRHGMAPATVSRGFAGAYGVPPSRYRAEIRALRAIEGLEGTKVPLAALAAETGFSDQAHMTRAVAELTGAPPGRCSRPAKGPPATDQV